MVVVVLTACPVGLRGDLTRWLLEIASGVFVGHVTARVRGPALGTHHRANPNRQGHYGLFRPQ